MNDKADLVFIEATSEQRREMRRLTFQDFPHWRRQRTEHDFWRAEQETSRAQLAGRKTWVLVPRDDPQGLDIRSTCLTYRHAALVRERGRVLKVAAYSIGGVFTPAQHQRRGYAAQVMENVHSELRKLTSTAGETDSAHTSKRADGRVYGRDASLCVLWSDLGDYYERFGWRNKPYSDTYFSPLALANQSLIDEVHWITDDVADEALPKLAQADEAVVYQELQRTSEDDKVFSLLDPEAQSCRYHILQSRLQFQFQGQQMPHSWGCYLGSDIPETAQSWAIWSFDWRKPASQGLSSLAILRHHAANAEDLATLLNIARYTAARQGCDAVVVWNIEGSTSSAWQEMTASSKLRESIGQTWQQERPTSRPALAWYEDDREDVRLEAADDVQWLNAERTWCLAT
ncbi:unnamed protein product [Jaminaea pallidilutea]